MNKNTDIRSLSIKELEEFLKNNNEKLFRAKQIYEWLWKKACCSFDEMTNLSLHLRELLKNNFIITKINEEQSLSAKDGTIKYVFHLHDNELIESVLIPSGSRITACVSSQVGCTFNCPFCATGNLQYKRNLLAGEMYDQVKILSDKSKEKFGSPLSNIVFMGMGEPLLNYDNLINAIEKISSKNGLEISPQRITISTVGIVEKIKQLADDKIKFNLAVSLHSANEEKRNIIIPANKSNPLNGLIDSLKYFNDKTGIRISFEYLLLRNFNDSLNDAGELAEFCKNFPCKINIIEYNPVEGSDFQKSTEIKTKKFTSYLENKNMIVNIRQSRGSDINAACGQLANKYKG